MHNSPNLWFLAPTVIILGPPGSGKTSTAKKISERLKAIHVTPNIEELAEKLQDTNLRTEAIEAAKAGSVSNKEINVIR